MKEFERSHEVRLKFRFREVALGRRIKEWVMNQWVLAYTRAERDPLDAAWHIRQRMLRVRTKAVVTEMEEKLLK